MCLCDKCRFFLLHLHRRRRFERSISENLSPRKIRTQRKRIIICDRIHNKSPPQPNRDASRDKRERARGNVFLISIQSSSTDNTQAKSHGPRASRKKILLKIRVTRLCARRSRTSGHFQLSRNYCPSALRSSVNIFPFMLGSSRKEHKGAGSFTAELRRTD